MRENVLIMDLKTCESGVTSCGFAARTTSSPGDRGEPSPGGRRISLRLIFAMLLGLCLSIIPLPVLAQTGAPQSLTSVDLHMGKATLHTQVAATPGEQEQGLMFYTKLPDNDGMIFLLPLGRASFWMKNTLIPLSVAFIDKDGIILEIHDMQPAPAGLADSKIPQTNSVSDKVAFALETNIHWFALNGIKPGDKIDPPPGTLKAQATLDEVKKIQAKPHL